MPHYSRHHHNNALLGLIMSGIGLAGWGLYKGAIWLIDYVDALF